MRAEPDYPTSLLVETTRRCPADCVFCPNKKIRDRPLDMSWDLFRKVVADCRGRGLADFNPFVTGEPLASPYLAEALECVSRELPDTAIHIYTNAYLLDDGAAETLLDSNVREVHFSIDGVSKETYEQHRRGLVYERVLANIMGFLARLRRHDCKVTTRVVFTETPQNEAEAPAFRRLWQGLVDAVDVLPCDGRGGAGRTPALAGAETMGCFHVPYRACILTDGSVVACCKDWAGYSVMGNCADSALHSIWNSAGYRRLRADIAQGQFSRHGACRRCVSGEL